MGGLPLQGFALALVVFVRRELHKFSAHFPNPLLFAWQISVLLTFLQLWGPRKTLLVSVAHFPLPLTPPAIIPLLCCIYLIELSFVSTMAFCFSRRRRRRLLTWDHFKCLPYLLLTISCMHFDFFFSFLVSVLIIQYAAVTWSIFYVFRSFDTSQMLNNE